MSDQSVPSFYADMEHVSDVYRFAVRGKSGQEFYGLYGEHVEHIAREYMHTTAVIKQAGTASDPCPYLTISPKVFLSMGWDLLRNKNMKIELYENQGGSAWKCTVSASPGRLEQFEARFGGEGESQDVGCIASICCKADANGFVSLHCAYVNPTLRVLGWAEFEDSSASFSNLESFLLQIGAKELIVPGTGGKADDEEKKIRDVAASASIHMEYQKAKFYKADELPERLKFLLREDTPTQEVFEAPHAAQALAAVVSYLNLSGDSCNENQFSLRKEDLSKYLKLDCAAIRALNIFDDEMDAGASRHKGSLYAYLDNCATPMGKRLLKLWLMQPLLNLEELTRRQDIVEVFTEDVMLRDALRTAVLGQVPDLDKILKKVQRQRATLADCMKIGKFVALVPEAIRFLEAYDGVHAERVKAYHTRLSHVGDEENLFETLDELISSSLEADEHDREVRIRPCFDGDLKDISEERDAVRAQINGEFKKTLEMLGHTDKEVKLEYSPQHLHHFRATKKAMGAAEGNKAFTSLEVRKDGMKFSSAGLDSINAEWKRLSDLYNERQESLTLMFKETIASYIEPLDEAKEIMSELDVFISFASVSSDPKHSKAFVRPTVHPLSDKAAGRKRALHIKGGRHPLVEHQLQLRQGGEFVSNDLDLDADNTLLMLITGPNMGGKSTFIRTAGVCVLLAQIGMFVPCTSMELTMCDAILARLGAADYVSRGVSTFMAEMLETNAILSSATTNSLVIIDELGRGTSTHDGYGLAWGIAEHLVTKVQCATLFATHFHELTVMDKELPHVANFHVTADTSGDELKMLYTVNSGPSSKSYGINVAQITRFPEPVIQAAKRKTELLESVSAKRPRTDNDERMDAFLVQWLKDFSGTPKTPDSADACAALVKQFDEKAKEFPPLATMLDAL
eukprot:Rhum_TRINITY_DN25150_c0_g1::Rhum_TRINITY_DN25150_c0_g1_i1::g.181298::m.181298/K08735/MSH2; DNA mismatch repair protein MSH2